MRAATMAILCVCALLAGCENKRYKLPENNLGTVVEYTCTVASDPVCDGVEPDVTERPGAIVPNPAVGLGATFDIVGGRSLTPRRFSAATSGGWIANEVGVGVFGVADDFTHIEVRRPVDIRVTHDEIRNRFEQLVGSADFPLRFPEDRFRAELIDEDGFALAGGYPCNWSSDDASVVRVVSDPRDNLVVFRIEGSGQTVLRVELGDFAEEIDFNINIQ